MNQELIAKTAIKKSLDKCFCWVYLRKQLNTVISGKQIMTQELHL